MLFISFERLQRLLAALGPIGPNSREGVTPAVSISSNSTKQAGGSSPNKVASVSSLAAAEFMLTIWMRILK